MWPSNPFVTSDVSEAQNCGKMDIFDRTKPDYGQKLRWNGRFWPDWTGLRWKTVVKWAFLTGLNRTTVENWMWWWWCGGVVVFLWWCFCGGVVVFLWWCLCGGVFVVLFLWWCLVWCGGVLCGGVFVVVWCFCGGVLVVVWWCFCGGVFVGLVCWWCGVDFGRIAEKLWKECWQHWCKKMFGIKVFLTLLISTLTSNISFIQLSSFNCLQCFRDIRRLVIFYCQNQPLPQSDAAVALTCGRSGKDVNPFSWC